MPLMLTWIVCFLGGGFGSEFVQSLLPNKTFQWGDVFANLVGSGLGLFVSYHAERRHRLRREIERLYEPLDQELYGDEEDETNDLDDGDANDPWRTVRPSGRLSSSAGKKVRFSPANGAATTEATEGEAGTSGRAIEADRDGSASAASRTQDTLFSIEDDEDDEAAEAWKDAR